MSQRVWARIQPEVWLLVSVCQKRKTNVHQHANSAKTPNRNIQAEIRRLKCSWNWAAIEPGLQHDKIRSEMWLHLGLKCNSTKCCLTSLSLQACKFELASFRFNGCQLHLSCEVQPKFSLVFDTSCLYVKSPKQNVHQHHQLKCTGSNSMDSGCLWAVKFSPNLSHRVWAFAHVASWIFTTELTA